MIEIDVSASSITDEMRLHIIMGDSSFCVFNRLHKHIMLITLAAFIAASVKQLSGQTASPSACLSVCPVFFSPVNPDAATVYISSCQGPICLLLLEVMLVDNLSYTVIFLYRLYSGQTPVFKKYYLSIQGYMQETAI